MPNVRDTVLDWLRVLRFVKVVKLVQDFQTVEKELPIVLNGMWTPLTGQALDIKPEGQRGWIWQRLITTSDVALVPDDQIVTPNGVRYRVMHKGDWDANGIIEYHLVQDYQGRGTA